MNKTILLGVMAIFVAACSGDEIATVNGVGISNADFEMYLRYKNIAVRDEEHKQKVLDQYLERTALAEVIERQELDDKALIQAELDELRKEVLISRYFDHFLQNRVTDQAVTNYYNSHANEYQQKKVHAAHILFRVNRNMAEPERQAKLTAAQEAYSKIKAGATFSEVAEKYSEDTVSAKKGGDLGWLRQGAISQNFSDKAFSMKIGDVSEPFETPFGFHILTILEEPQVIQQPFESVKGEIRYQLRNEYKDTELKRLLAEVSIKKK